MINSHGTRRWEATVCPCIGTNTNCIDPLFTSSLYQRTETQPEAERDKVMRFRYRAVLWATLEKTSEHERNLLFTSGPRDVPIDLP